MKISSAEHFGHFVEILVMINIILVKQIVYAFILKIVHKYWLVTVRLV